MNPPRFIMDRTRTMMARVRGFCEMTRREPRTSFTPFRRRVRRWNKISEFDGTRARPTWNVTRRVSEF